MDLLTPVITGFSSLNVSQKYKDQALAFLNDWLTKEEFKEYQPQLEYLIDNKKWELLLDSFYQIIPFGTGGRRGPVGIGPNRINPWTIRSSAQGHSQYLLKQYGQDAKTRGVVITYDVRQYLRDDIYSKDQPNPVKNLTCKDLAIAAAEVYAANGIKVYLFNDVRSTPELSFTIRYLHAVSGDMISASHNPPDDTGKKIYDDRGGQLIPPDDENLVIEVTKNVREIKTINLQDAQAKGLIQFVGDEVDQAYLSESSKVSLSSARSLKIVYSPFHGTGKTSVYLALKSLGFPVELDPATSNYSGRFENIIFNIPNPEVVESFTIPLKYAKQVNADILFGSDPDADRIGVMVNLGNGEWRYLNGQEIGTILTQYVIQKHQEKGTLTPQQVVIKTMVTTNIIQKICDINGIRCVGDLLVGYKYIGHLMNEMEDQGTINQVILSCEESHGYLAGNYVRDKDAVVPAIWLSELAAQLKTKNWTLIDYLNEIYAQFGYFRNYLTEIRILGAQGTDQIAQIQDNLRQNPPTSFGGFKVIGFEDKQQGKPFVSETDKVSRNVLVFNLKRDNDPNDYKVTIRPSGTEPKSKMYFEIGTAPFNLKDIETVKQQTEELLHEFEKAVMKYCYKILGVDFPDRGFLLFWQLPMQDKLKYFEVEEQIASLKDIQDPQVKQEKLNELLKFLGANPIQKINNAFKAKYSTSVLDYLSLLDLKQDLS